MKRDGRRARASTACVLALAVSALAPILCCGHSASASEFAVYLLPAAQMEYEGSGYRESGEGWTYKVKPRSPAAGLRWRHGSAGKLAFQAQLWTNWPIFEKEGGNTGSAAGAVQTASTRFTLYNFLADVRIPLAGSTVEAVVGAQGAWERFERKHIRFRGLEETGEYTEDLWGVGPYFGFHAGTPASVGPRSWYWDGEALVGHFLLTGNRQRTKGSSIRRDGFSYLMRLEGGYRFGGWRLGIGYQRQLLQIQVEGGKTLASGAVVSLPINKTDFFGPFVAVTHVY